MKKLCIFLVALCLHYAIQAQKKVVLMGSSTAEGWYATTGNSLFERLQTYYSTHIWINLGYRGLSTYQALATPVPGKPSVDLDHNITKALSLEPDIILVSYPTNDVNNGYTNEETLANLITLQSLAAARGVAMFFLGTQPRDFPDQERRTQLSTQNDLIHQTFIGKSINVYPDLVRDGGFIAFDVRFLDANNNPDGIHLNNEGHRRLFQKVVDFDMFATVALPLTLIDFSGELQNKSVRLQWQAKADQYHQYVGIERSAEGQDFREIGRVRGTKPGTAVASYQFADEHPGIGKNYYRLAMVDKNGRKEYSKTILLNNHTPGSFTAFPVPASTSLNLTTVVSSQGSVYITIRDLRGAAVYSTTRSATKGVNRFVIPVDQLSTGSYIIQWQSADGTNSLPFIKQ